MEVLQEGVEVLSLGVSLCGVRSAKASTEYIRYITRVKCGDICGRGDVTAVIINLGTRWG